MKRILVTGVGGGVGQSIIKALQDTDYVIVGVDSEALAAGLHAVPVAHLGHYASDPAFIDRLLEIAIDEKCDMIFPGHDVELLPLSHNQQRFIDEGIIPLISHADVLALCDDKLATQRFLRDNGHPTIESLPLNEFTNFAYPVVLKPQHGGARSRATYVARSEQEFELYRQLVDPDNCVVQRYVEGDEYTCGTITLDSSCHGVIVMRRILRDGDTYKAFVEHPSKLEPFLHTLAEQLRPFGACNIQLRVQDDLPYVFEINARFSGTTAARALAGFNEPKMVADYILKKVKPDYTIRNISVLRYWQELIVENERIEELRDNRSLQGNGNKL